jgi:DNA replication and repair protein RecF
MLVKKVYLENFLSYKSLFVEFEKGLNVLVGANAAGKTNLLESLYYSSVGKSARGLKDKELINWGAESGARIRLFVEKKYISHTIDISIDKQGKKRITVDELPISKIGELMGVLNVVYFSPDEMRLIKESPADRRRFMDICLCQTDKIYFYTLVKYNKLLAQRNKLLKNYYDSPKLSDMSELVTDKMSEAQEYLVAKRKNFLDKIAPIANERHRKLTDGKETLDISYETGEVDYGRIADSLKTLYRNCFEKDRRLQFTTVGVHRDDVKITASGIDVRKFGSQGQQRTSVLSLKLAETEFFREVSGEYPVLLMDDVLSELDTDRRKALFGGLDGIQTFITTTEDGDFADKKTVYKVCNMKVAKK